MPNYDLGTAEGKIVIDSSGAVTGITKAQTAQAGMVGTLGKMTPALSAVGKGMVAVGGLAVAGFALAVKTSADFEKRISAIGAVSGATGKELDSIRDKALQLGKDTKFSASEAAVAMEELAKAGVSTSDILNGAADATVALAAAGVSLSSACAFQPSSTPTARSAAAVRVVLVRMVALQESSKPGRLPGDWNGGV